MEGDDLRTPIASPFAARTLATAMLRMTTLLISLARTPKPVDTAFEDFPMMLALLPILTSSAVWVIGPLTKATFLASPATAAVNLA